MTNNNFEYVLCIIHIVLLTVSPGNLNITPSLSETSVGSSVLLTCEADGGPDNTFTWVRQPGDILVENTSVINVTIASAMDGGFYTCVVRNVAGEDNGTATVNGNSILLKCSLFCNEHKIFDTRERYKATIYAYMLQDIRSDQMK